MLVGAVCNYKLFFSIVCKIIKIFHSNDLMSNLRCAWSILRYVCELCESLRVRLTSHVQISS